MMTDSDTLHRFIFDNTDIRGEIVSLEQSFNDILSHQDLAPPIKQLLGEFLVATVLMSNTLKFDGILTLQARGDGPLPLIMTECSHHKQFRGIAKPATDQPLPDTTNLQQLIGKGVLTITVDPSQGERYQGIVPLEADTLAGCLEHYFLQSEQLRTRFWLASNTQRAAGMMLQALPQQMAADKETWEDRWETQCHLAQTIAKEELLSLDHKTLLHRLYHEQGVRVFDPLPVSFVCSCSRARSLNTLKSLGEEELCKLLNEQETIDVTCHFCNYHYQFAAKDIQQLFAPETRH